ncbi:transferrin-binding protein-like solute binding protein [Alteriqipengyuania flavescens]|uniref:transferrin-binding protein-like solute binding protein n=1 Tax=Alteriqipengyuania flavescens TaxID=3053610 RepID=UPI0025B3AAA8|nr:transferrin-binding protein-like solute binding protein [Alteriqipengyuania flavescens]WJY17974.1 transferrin-binding protein-like solute binding protein [Alteriqipengyuania flavescens]WJY23915.1 transferrin-binding protein-like solute binding protein [Alteriqipengyuania flavescens]
MGTYPKSGATPTFALRQGAASLAFDAASGSWTITANGKTLTFTSADFDASQSNSSIATYRKGDGTTTDFLSITRDGQSGNFTYKYVGSAFWQRIVDGTNSVEGSFDAFVFGFPTANTAIPTGGAFYDITVTGALGLQDNLYGYTGEGEMIVDFGNGGLFFDALIPDSANGPATLQGSGRITSGVNEFFGTLALISSENFAGTFSGQFFGPSAQEVGATYQAQRASDGAITVGTIMGRSTGAGGGNTSFANLTSGQFFNGEARYVEFDANGKSGPATITGSGEADFRVGYTTQQGGLYHFFRPQRTVAKFMPDDSGPQTLIQAYAGSFQSDSSQGWLQYGYMDYISPGRWVYKDGDNYRFDEFIFGFDTSAANLPTGEAGYRVDLGGTAFLSGQTPFALTGQGSIAVDFASGMLNGSGAIRNYDTFATIGTWNGSGAIGSGTSDFAGAWNVTGENGAPDMTGDWSGGLFGPAAEEIGATYSASAADGSRIAGVIYGDRDDGVIAAGTPLADLTTRTTFDLSPTATREDRGGGEYSLSRGSTLVTYDPATDTYSIAKDPNAGNFGYDSMDVQFSETRRVDAESSDSYIVYRKNGDELRVLNFRSDNPVIDLTYVTFAEVTQRTTDFGGNALTNRYWSVWGDRTPDGNMPRSGSASYSGVVAGGGYVQNYSNDARIYGTLDMTVRFGDSSFLASMGLVAADRDGTLANMQLGTFDFEGNLFNAQFSGARNDTEYSYSIDGWFYGPAADELGGAFDLRRDNATDLPGIDINGVFVGERN